MHNDIDIAVLGAGSWGTALAMQLARIGQRTLLWARNTEALLQIETTRQNEQYLAGISIPETLTTEPDLETAVISAKQVLLVCPSHAFADLLRTIKPWLADDDGIQGGVSWACKGFEPGTGRLLHTVAREILGEQRPLAVVTGPSFAREVALDMPTAVTVAASREQYGQHIASLLHGGSLRAYYSSDIIGAELGGASKNVMAIATGICDGMALGANARAALITRGLSEMMRLGVAMGAKPETLMGLAGMGDLVLTCTGELSRNRQLGLALGQGLTVDQAIKQIGQVVEGYKAAAEVYRLSQQFELDLPICEQVYGVLYQGWNPQKGVKVLLGRELKKEH